MSDQPPPPSQGSGTAFCAECGAAMPADARFCGSCGAAPPPAPGADPTAADPTAAMPAAAAAGAASTWQGVEPVIDPPAPVTAPEPPAGGPPSAGGPPPGGPPPGGPPPVPPTEPKGKSKTPLIIVGLVVLAALIGGAFVLLGGGDDDADDGFDRDEAAEDEETTTTEAEETTTTEAEETTTTTSVVVDGGDQQFDQLIDDSGAIVVEVPVEWTDRSTAPVGTQATIEASTSLATFRQDFSVPAMTYTVVSATPVDHNVTIDNAMVLGNLAAACVADERQDYDDGVFVGRIQIFTECGGIGTTMVEIAASNAAGTSVSLQIQLTSTDSPDIADHIVETFNTTG